MNMPGFSATRSLRASAPYRRAPLAAAPAAERIVPAVPMPYCKWVCKWEVCGSALPGYPVPMCYICSQECWIRDSGPYTRAMLL